MKKIIFMMITLLFIGCDNVEITNTSDTNSTEETQNPIANAGSDRNITLFEGIEITGSATDSDGTIVDYEWKEDNVLISGLKTFTYLGDTVGEHTLTLTVVDDDDLTDSDEMIITVIDEGNTTN